MTYEVGAGGELIITTWRGDTVTTLGPTFWLSIEPSDRPTADDLEYPDED